LVVWSRQVKETVGHLYASFREIGLYVTAFTVPVTVMDPIRTSAKALEIIGFAVDLKHPRKLPIVLTFGLQWLRQFCPSLLSAAKLI
jgi:hypothetical protein